MFSLAIVSCETPNNNVKVEKLMIYGNCSMCKKKIETAGNIEGIVKVVWDKNSQLAKLTFDTTKTNTDEILKRISLSGYDSDKFRAPDDVYNKLHECCHYERRANANTF